MEPRDRLAPLAAAVRRPAVQDGLVAAVVVYLSVVALWNPPPFVDFAFRSADGLGVALAVAGGAAVAVRSRHPVAATLLALAAVVPLTQLGYSQSIGGIATLLTLYSAAARRPWRTSVALLALTVTAVGVVLVTGPLAATPSDWFANLFVIAAAWGFGRSVRTRRAHLAGLEARNRAQADALAAETRALLAEERARVVRELQDLVSHTLTEVNVQVAAARRTLGTGDPVASQQLLAAAEDAGRSAMAELRRAVDVLGHTDGSLDRRPQPGLAELHDLVARERDSGADVALRTTGRAAAVPSGVALTSYRVVEEALADARTDGPGSAAVDVDWDVDALTVRVRTVPETARVRWHDGRDESPGGVARLRTRVELYGGTLRVAPTRDGGTLVTARFPARVERTA